MLSDESKEMLIDYKVWALKKFMGKNMGILEYILLMKKVKFKKCMIKLKLKLMLKIY